jgi:hypothetical protein
MDKILLDEESNVIPLQLLQLVRSPLLRSLIIIPFVCSFGSSSCSHISFRSGSKIFATKLGSIFSTSGTTLYIPEAFPFFSSQIDVIFSVFEGCLIEIALIGLVFTSHCF